MGKRNLYYAGGEIQVGQDAEDCWQFPRKFMSSDGSHAANPGAGGSYAGDRISVSSGVKDPKTSHPVLAYHEVQPTESKYVYHLTNSQFESHLTFLASLPANEKLSRAIPEVTFDDGHRSNYENAFPLLEKAGLKATFFVLAGRVGNQAEFISWSQAREMVSAGHQVQSHGWSHRLLTLCNPQELEEELAGSKQELEQRLGVEVPSISAPGGRWNARVISACGRAGYKSFFHSNPWMPPKSLEGLEIRGRYMVTGRMDSTALKAQMEMSGAQRFFRRSKYGAKEGVRTILGDRMYHKIWCWLSNYSPDDGMEIQMGGRTDRGQE